MSQKQQIDATDRKILSFLIKNARTPFLEIARACGISGAAIHQRYNKLEESGIISGSKFNALLKSSTFGRCQPLAIFLFSFLADILRLRQPSCQLSVIFFIAHSKAGSASFQYRQT